MKTPENKETQHHEHDSMPKKENSDIDANPQHAMSMMHHDDKETMHQTHDDLNHEDNKDKVDATEHNAHTMSNGKKMNTAHQGHVDHHAMMLNDFKKRFYVSLLLTIPVLMLSPMIQMFLKVDWYFPMSPYLLAGLSIALFIYGGKPFLTGSVKELKQHAPAMMTLVAFAIIISLAYSLISTFFLQGNDFFWELATLIDVMLLGHWIEMRSVMRASSALDELVKLLPQIAHVIDSDGNITDEILSELRVGDAILVKPGEQVPIDGIIYDGSSDVDESMISGESVPVSKRDGDEIIGGSINGSGVLKYRITKTGDQMFLSQVIRMVKEAQESKSATQRLADIAAKWLFYLAVFVGVLTFTVWMLVNGSIQFAFERAVTVIVISCPHALGLAIPLVTAISSNIGAKNGLLIRNRAAFENARLIDTVVFDKTGTLTEGAFSVTSIDPYGVEENELLSLAYSMEANSEHPIAKAIVTEGESRGVRLRKVNDFQNMTGRGLDAKIDDIAYAIVSPAYLDEHDIMYERERYHQQSENGDTVVFVLKQDQVLGSIALSDRVRASSKQVVQELSDLKIDAVLLTGDHQRSADRVGREVGIHQIIAQVRPEEKSAEIARLQAQGRVVAMTGDGVNDAPSLAKADLGIAIGTGTNVAVETADVILIKDDPYDVVNVIRLSKVTYRKMIQNLIWATAYNAIALPLAAGVLFNQGIVIRPEIGAVLMSLSTIIVAINARTLRLK